jgi:hypothetical protein
MGDVYLQVHLNSSISPESSKDVLDWAVSPNSVVIRDYLTYLV